MEAFHQVEPGGHFLGCAHTQANFETAFYRSNIADNNSVEQWREEGSKDAATRANGLWKSMLAEYEPPPLDPAKDEAIREFIDRSARRRCRTRIIDSASGESGDTMEPGQQDAVDDKRRRYRRPRGGVFLSALAGAGPPFPLAGEGGRAESAAG